MSSSYTLQDRTLGTIRKRKDREPFEAPVSQIKPSSAQPVQISKPAQTNNNNKILAGYMAHEFLTKGTLLGKRFDLNRPEPGKKIADPARPVPVRSEPESAKPGSSYAEVSYLLKTDGVHIPGIVNPTQLARWIQR